MPDEYGRPTFNDGAQIAQGLMTMQAWGQQQKSLRTQEEAYAAADAIAKKSDLTAFSPEARYKGAELYWNGKFNELRAQTQENMKDSATMQNKIQRLNQNMAVAKNRLAEYRAARAAGDDAHAKRIAMQMNNENMYTGRYVDRGENGYEVTDWQGTKSSFDDIPIENVDRIIGAYFDRPDDEIMKWQMTAEQMRSKKNAEIISKATPYYNESTGKIIYRVPAGVWGPDGKPRGAFFVDDPTAQQELPASAAKGFVPMGVAKEKKELSEKEVVDPKDIVSGMGPQGAQGLIVRSPGGQPQFQQVQGAPAGGLNLGGGGGVKPSEAKSAYELRVKQLTTQLMPFNSTEAPIFEKTADGNYQLSEGGHNALMAAMKLVQRAAANPNSLSPQESELLGVAQQSVQMFQSLSNENASAFGVNPGIQPQQHPGAQPSNIPPLPQGFQPLNFTIGGP